MESYRAWLEIDLQQITNNLEEVKRILTPRSKIIGIVKSNAYGHGLSEVSRVFSNGGVSCIGVSTLEDAIIIRKNNINMPIIILNYTYPQLAEKLIEYDLVQTVYRTNFALQLNETALKLGKKIKIHVEIDTGMNRTGFHMDKAVNEIAYLHKLKGLYIQGIFTHFSCAADDDKSYVFVQNNKFSEVISSLGNIGITIPEIHVANSAAFIEFPDLHFEFVRVGIALYGMYTSPYVDNMKMKISPAMSLKSRVVLINDVEEGTPISYSRNYITSRKSKIATIPIGYGMGYTRLLNKKAKVIINGKFAPVVGNICMEHTMIDVTDVKKVQVGDEVTLLGKQGNLSISIDDLSQWVGTINTEMVCMLGNTIPKIYV